MIYVLKIKIKIFFLGGGALQGLPTGIIEDILKILERCNLLRKLLN